MLIAVGMAVGVLLALGGAPAAAGGPGDAQRGADVYAANCAMCHAADAAGMMGMHPSLRGVVDRLTLEGVEVTIRNGRETMPPMPAFGGRLSDQDIADVIAYLETLPPGPRNFGPEAGMADERGPDGGMMERMRDMMGLSGAAAAVWVFVAVLGAVLALLIAVVVAVSRRQTGAGSASPSAREILDRRYAAGELSSEEYRQAREDLER